MFPCPMGASWITAFLFLSPLLFQSACSDIECCSQVPPRLDGYRHAGFAAIKTICNPEIDILQCDMTSWEESRRKLEAA